MLVLWVSMLTVLADQFTKELVRRHIDLHQSIPVFPGVFNLTYVRNTGAAWGMLDGFNGWLALLSVLVLGLLVVFRKHVTATAAGLRLPLALMAGGIIGNLMDRLRHDFVVDFLDFHWGPHHFPSFNIADAAICTGVLLYIAASMWVSAHEKRDAQAGAGSGGAAP